MSQFDTPFMITFAILFVCALLAATALRLWLGVRQMKFVTSHRAQVPSEFAQQIALSAHQRAADYTVSKTRVSLVSVVVDALVVVWLTFGGGLQRLHDLTAGWLAPGIWQGLALLVLVTVVLSLIDLPFTLYRTFRIEERYGFNKMTPALFWADYAKGALLAAAFGLPLAGVVLWLMDRTGQYWWLYAWIVWVAFNLFALAVYPTWIAPLFNKFSPMQDPELRERVERLLDRCGFKVKGLMVMDGSRRSSHGNAYFTGFGKTKRIVFFDTLLQRLGPPEVEAVLAHELGHFKLRHVIKRIVWTFAASLGFLWLLSILMAQPWFYGALNVTTPSTAMALLLFFIVMPSFTFLVQPLLASYSRKHEFEADRYAAEHADARDLASALVKLYNDNASTLTPDPVHSAFYDSHPPALTRIGRLQALRGT
jgi:STE24 endopeptidase